MDERGHNIDPINKQKSGLNVSSFGGDLSMIQDIKGGQAAGLSHLNLSRINPNVSLNNGDSFLSSDKPVSPLNNPPGIQLRGRGQYLMRPTEVNLINFKGIEGEESKMLDISNNSFAHNSSKNGDSVHQW